MSQKQSHYAEKRARGNQMYGPGCCAHKISEDRVAAARERARRNGAYDRRPAPLAATGEEAA